MMFPLLIKAIPAVLGLAVLLADSSSCSGRPMSEQVQNQAQERSNLNAVRAVGMPAIVNFWEKQQLKSIFELRDKPFASVTYIVDLNGHLHKVCDSVGYGLPYSTQYTNPIQESNPGTSSNVAIGQADPNGLYSPPSADGTWVLCLNPKTKQTEPAYIEPRIVVVPSGMADAIAH